MGKHSRGESQVIDQVLNSTLESVDDAESLALHAARDAGFAEEDLHRIGMAVRESMVNAVVHGNRFSANKKVRLSILKNGSRFMVRIADQGEGFDLDSLPDPLSEENLLRQSGRGIFLVRAFMDEFQVRRLQPGGTEVTLIKYLAAK
jgi:serine/threonine-protein kinase RsbW